MDIVTSMSICAAWKAPLLRFCSWMGWMCVRAVGCVVGKEKGCPAERAFLLSQIRRRMACGPYAGGNGGASSLLIPAGMVTRGKFCSGTALLSLMHQSPRDRSPEGPVEQLWRCKTCEAEASYRLEINVCDDVHGRRYPSSARCEFPFSRLALVPCGQKRVHFIFDEVLGNIAARKLRFSGS